ncbi:MAG: hypothetical protein HY320_01255 [Armatimonadetes bacterium]|nr:hypothetical protein [Armatimonadota bacterium]
MSERRSRFSEEALRSESWLPGAVGRNADHPGELESLLRTAALARACVEKVPIPEGAEQKAWSAAMREWERLARHRVTGAERPSHELRWIGRLGHWMRFVFTLGRRR